MTLVSVNIHQPIIKVWEYFTSPDQIIQWNFANSDWHCPSAKNNVIEGGSFSYRMEARDGSFGFDLNGTFTKIDMPNVLHYNLEDDRRVEVSFIEKDGITHVVQEFELETENNEDLQRAGWQAILENFKKHTEEY